MIKITKKESMILQELIKSKIPISYIDLARITNTDRTYIFKLCKSLKEKDLISIKEMPSKRGKPIKLAYLTSNQKNKAIKILEQKKEKRQEKQQIPKPKKEQFFRPSPRKTIITLEEPKKEIKIKSISQKTRIEEIIQEKKVQTDDLRVIYRLLTGKSTREPRKRLIKMIKRELEKIL